MKVQDLDGKEYQWNVNKSKAQSNASSYHKHAIEVVKTHWPSVSCLEEIPIRIRMGLTLYLDIYIPLWHKAIEVHGPQHYKYNSLYHLTKFDFINQKKNDQLKRDWCTINNIELVELPYNRMDEWKTLIRS